MVALAALSWLRTSEHIHRANHFTLHPILEVAVIFLGIFMTMIPALNILRARGAWDDLVDEYLAERGDDARRSARAR